MAFSHPLVTASRPAYRITGECVRRVAGCCVGESMAFTAVLPVISDTAIRHALGADWIATSWSIAL
jgi:hypothetical protein